jgi:hypothetical protein
MRDMVHNKQVVHLGTVAISGTTPAVSAYVDTRGFDAATIAVLNGTVTDAGTAAGYTVTLQESADTTAAAAATVAAADEVNGTVTLTETVDANDDVMLGGFGYKGDARYLGVTVTGTTGSDAEIHVVAILNKPHRAATTFAGTAVART